ncbi:dethiobiotin synthase [Pseudidiomarina donghaiensis]|uniref:ATP-dependent dethiobiotin synthetase BioD n=1 Tax=Pseudidiomarina donghaiensis TaxID=519452 RepID=A0A432XMB9_9GAMM|nr:dethiobiotin synthase [Pseudidiomarina donghaiensis]RUO49845.1 dethiobiotin synthase [Pseudidiomarina donghaiensis]SFV21985.1 dethiobiotin synthetase [Pseudidiomarina donghaiensis]
MRPVFVTGTDTDAGKTFCSEALIHALQSLQQSCRVLKPVAAGAAPVALNNEQSQLRNDDALRLLAATGAAISPLTYQQANPFCFAPAIAPHIAAQQVHQRVSVEALLRHYNELPHDADWCIVEGAGGWLVPLNENQSLADFVQALGAPVVLVVGMKLGCLNHALLTVADIERRGLQLSGWIANTTQAVAMSNYAENLATLQQRIAAPLLAEVPFHSQANPAAVAARFDLSSWVNS